VDRYGRDNNIGKEFETMNEKDILLTKGIETDEEDTNKIIISVMPSSELVCAKIVEIFGNVDWVEDANVKMSEMEHSGYKLAKKAYVAFPAKYKGGKWNPPYVMKIDERHPWVWIKNDEVWIDIEELTKRRRIK